MIVYCVTISKATFLTQLATYRTSTIEKIMNSTLIFADVALAGSLVFLLQRRRSGFKKTDSGLKLIITYTVGTSAVTVIVTALALATNICYPDSFAYVACDLVISKCEFMFWHWIFLLTRFRLHQLHVCFVRFFQYPNEEFSVSDSRSSLNARRGLQEKMNASANGVSVHLSNLGSAASVSALEEGKK